MFGFSKKTKVERVHQEWEKEEDAVQHSKNAQLMEAFNKAFTAGEVHQFIVFGSYIDKGHHFASMWGTRGKMTESLLSAMNDDEDFAQIIQRAVAMYNINSLMNNISECCEEEEKKAKKKEELKKKGRPAKKK